MQKVTRLGLPNCFQLTNGTVEVVVASDVGPRVLGYGFEGGRNVLGEHPDAFVETAWGEFKPWGGHRLWTAPEAKPRSYAPDNDAVEVAGEMLGAANTLTENNHSLDRQVSDFLSRVRAG